MYIPSTPAGYEQAARDAKRSVYLMRLLGSLKQQIVHLKRHIRDLSARYASTHRASVREILAIRLDVAEGMRSAFYEAARAAADEMSDLLWKTTGSAVIISLDYDHEDNERPEEEDDVNVDAELAISVSNRS